MGFLKLVYCVLRSPPNTSSLHFITQLRWELVRRLIGRMSFIKFYSHEIFVLESYVSLEMAVGTYIVVYFLEYFTVNKLLKKFRILVK